MDRPTTRQEGADPGTHQGRRDALVLPSRRPALDACRACLETGPVLLTGEPGSGKTWLWNRLAEESAPALRWLGVDVTPAIGPDDFHRLIARELGLSAPEVGSPARSSVADFLADRHPDGDRRVLVIEEAHNLIPAVWEEVRILTNRLGRPDGFAALLIVGQSALARRFSTWPYAPIESRLAARLHLGPVDADEARDLLASARPGRPWSVDEVEALHAESGGNPGRMLRRLGPPGRLAPPPAPRVIAAKIESPPAPLIGPGRPPLRSEENLIEVGWSPDEAEEPTSGDDEATASGEDRPVASPSGDEAVHDHYAALQAWREWAENQGRIDRPAAAIASDRDLADAIDDGLAADASAEVSPPADRPTVWAEGAEENFAPFSQLFSRMARSRPRAPE